MKFIGKLLLTIVLLLALAIVILYVLLQTRWAAGQLSRWISGNSEYRLSIDEIDHSWSAPSRITLSGVKFAEKNQPAVLNAAEVDFDLSWRQITQPHFFDRVVLVNGSLNLSPKPLNLPLQANTLQLNNIALTGDIEQWKVDGKNVNAGISPWQPSQNAVLGSNAQFQMSADRLALDNIPANNVLIQGRIDNKQLMLSNFGADMARGQLTGNASRSTDGSWSVDNLRLSHIRLQSAQPISTFWQEFVKLPKVDIKRLDLIDARLQGQNWSFTDLDMTVTDVTLENGDWQSTDGQLSLNATDMIDGNLHFIDPNVNLDLSPQGIAIRQFNTRWEGGLLRTMGHWDRASKGLNLDELSIASLEYTLPQNWRQLWVEALPDWLSDVSVNKFTANRNLIIDISPDFPFQLTGLDGVGTNLKLAQNHQWGIWSGNLNLNASDATFNKNDVRRPSLALEASSDAVKITALSAYTKEGLLEATANVSQQPQRNFSVNLTGRAVPANELQNWGWPSLPLQGNVNMQLSLQGQMPANVDFKPTLSGTLHASANEGKQIQQQMSQGIAGPIQ
ncbi:AsmA family protein [Rouxiella badensis]|uniref:AsmA family protein n=1 Tax=Rouxiella badensis TaxID=1646377 RepID=UPI0013EF26E7|nr:AsmA family protein [Rouxiella badensis]QII40124.1 AsmA family protein [Rouxiella badensis]